MKIKYTNGNYLKHSYFRGASSGNPWANRDGTFGTAPRGYDQYGANYRFGSDSDSDSTYTYKNRYQYNKTDSSGNTTTYYTPAGQRRLAYEESVNSAKKKANQIDEDAVADVSRWIRDDSKSYMDMAESLSKGAKATSNMIDLFNKPKKGQRIDLSQMSNEELSAILNREQMERRYDEYFNPPTTNKGWEIVKGVNDFALNSAQGFATVMSIINAFKG